MVIKAIAIFNRHTHVSRVLTGLRMLEDEGLLDVTYVENKNNAYKLPGGAIVELRIGEKRIAFDMGDRWALCKDSGKKYLESIDYYFARGYSSKVDIVTPEVFLDNPKVKPFGLYYYVTYPKNPLDKRTRIKDRIRSTVKNLTGYNKVYYPDAFENNADEKNSNFMILFMTRLWGTDEFEGVVKRTLSKEDRNYLNYMYEERERINQQRIEVMRRLKAEYGSLFTGGMFSDKLSERLCPDLMISVDEARKKSYMSKVKATDIGIGTMGLHRSIGGKIGEYVAASKAIVTEKLEYEVPGNFEEGKNYLSFQTADGCIESVEYLINNPQLVCSMKKANEIYYYEYVNPEEQIRKALEIAGVFETRK